MISRKKHNLSHPQRTLSAIFAAMLIPCAPAQSAPPDAKPATAPAAKISIPDAPRDPFIAALSNRNPRAHQAQDSAKTASNPPKNSNPSAADVAPAMPAIDRAARPNAADQSRANAALETTHNNAAGEDPHAAMQNPNDAAALRQQLARLTNKINRMKLDALTVGLNQLLTPAAQPQKTFTTADIDSLKKLAAQAGEMVRDLALGEKDRLTAAGMQFRACLALAADAAAKKRIDALKQHTRELRRAAHALAVHSNAGVAPLSQDPAAYSLKPMTTFFTRIGLSANPAAPANAMNENGKPAASRANPVGPAASPRTTAQLANKNEQPANQGEQPATSRTKSANENGKPAMPANESDTLAKYANENGKPAKPDATFSNENNTFAMPANESDTFAKHANENGKPAKSDATPANVRQARLTAGLVSACYWYLQADLLEQRHTLTDPVFVQRAAVRSLEQAVRDFETCVLWGRPANQNGQSGNPQQQDVQARQRTQAAVIDAKKMHEVCQLGLLSMYQQVGQTGKAYMLLQELDTAWGEDDARLQGFTTVRQMVERRGRPFDVTLTRGDKKLWASKDFVGRKMVMVVCEKGDDLDHGGFIREMGYLNKTLGAAEMRDMVVVQVVLALDGAAAAEPKQEVGLGGRRVVVELGGAAAKKMLGQTGATSLPWVVVADKSGKVFCVGQSDAAIRRLLDLDKK